MSKAEWTPKWVRGRAASSVGPLRLPSSESLIRASSVHPSRPTVRPLPLPALHPRRLQCGQHAQAPWSLPISICLVPSTGQRSRGRRRVNEGPYSPAVPCCPLLPPASGGPCPSTDSLALRAALSRQLSAGSSSCTLSCPFQHEGGDSTPICFP